MKAVTNWSFKPFAPFNEPQRAELPYICRLSPFADGFKFEWFDSGDDGLHTVEISERGGEIVRVFEAQSREITVKGLKSGADYTLSLARADRTAARRLVRTGDYLGDTVINYLHPEDPSYAYSGYALCSPSIVKLPDGRLVASMDVFKGGGPQNLSIIMRSEDGGKSWHYLCELYPCFWPKLFVCRGGLYIVSCATEYGDLLIGRSDDGGESWRAPTHLLPGTFGKFGPHKNPVPFVECGGRLWSAVEYGSWVSGGHDMSLMSAPTESDLLDAKSWAFTPFVRYSGEWRGAPLDSGRGKKSTGGGIEGNAVIAPDGELKVLYRMDIAASTPNCGKALLMRADKRNPEAPLEFEAIVDCPLGSNSKFYTRFDAVSGKYIMIGTEQTDSAQKRTRLSMAVSDDLYKWTLVHTIFDIRELDPNKNGLQYPDWIFDGEDILLLTRTALNNAANFHDSNCATFKRIANFRAYL